MNILQILPQLSVGGVETGTVDLAKYLFKRGHRSVVVSGGGELVRDLENSGVIHHALPVDNKFFPVMVKVARRLEDIIRQEAIEIVHARSRVPAWVAFMACRRLNIPLITTAHGYYSAHLFSYIMGFGKYTIVPSSTVGKRMAEDFGVPFENLRLIPRSVDLERYVFKASAPVLKKDFRIVVVGRITPIKGQLYFLKAMTRVLRDFPETKAWIVGGISPGKDNYMEELEVWRRRLGLAEAVTFLGNRRDIPEILRRSDLLVMPSIAEEAFGRVIVEAQASGVPVVATRVGGVVEIIEDGKNGLLVHPRDDEALAEAISRILKDPPLAARLAQEGRRKVEEKFSLVRMAEDTLKVYEEALVSPRLLVIKIGALGDAVLAVASFEALRKKFPFAKISCLVGVEAKDVFARCPYIDELIVCDFKHKDKGAAKFLLLAKRLLSRRFDASIDFQNNKKSHMLSYATLSPRRYGYDNGKFSFFLNCKIKDAREPLGPVEHQFRVLRMLGIEYQGERLRLWPSDEDKKFADALLGDSGAGEGKLAGIHIGASPRWQSKRWVPEHYSRLCDELVRRGWRVVLTGSGSDAVFAQEILQRVASHPLCAVAKTTFMQLACLIQKCDVFVTVDSAPMHAAAAMGTPFVVLFGPTDARRHMPPAERFVVLQKDKACPPCYKPRCRRKDDLCMREISVEDVLEAVERLAGAAVGA